MLEYGENEEGTYTYYLPGEDTEVEKEVWKNAQADFMIGKEAVEVSIGWKSLYEEEIREKKVLGWFLLLAESLDDSIMIL